MAILSFRSLHHPSSGFCHLLLEKSFHLFLWPQTHGAVMRPHKKASGYVRRRPAGDCCNVESCFCLCSGFGLQYQDIFVSCSNRNDWNTNFPEKNTAILKKIFFSCFISFFYSEFLSFFFLFFLFFNFWLCHEACEILVQQGSFWCTGMWDKNMVRVFLPHCQ